MLLQCYGVWINTIQQSSVNLVGTFLAKGRTMATLQRFKPADSDCALDEVATVALELDARTEVGVGVVIETCPTLISLNFLIAG